MAWPPADFPEKYIIVGDFVFYYNCGFDLSVIMFCDLLSLAVSLLCVLIILFFFFGFVF